MESEGQGTERLGPNSMKLREWQLQCDVTKAVFENQATFIDGRHVPDLKTVLQMSMAAR
jgi:hypothetical protein